MLTQKTIRGYIFRLKKYQEPVEKWILPLLLFLYPFIGVTQGVDITDTTYSLGNYEYMENLDPMWMLATFLPNIIGKLFTFLPMGHTLLGMNIYCTIIISVTALSAYYMLQRWMPGWMLFIGEIIAESLCWCPRVILYNYMTYLFFTLGVLFLLHAMTDYDKKSYRFALAGLFFGLNVMVRFPNILEVLMIVVLWYYESIHKHDRSIIIRKTGYCIAGFAVGVIVPVLIISVIYGIGAYPSMIGSLFGMSAGASDYTFAGMIGSILGAWFISIKHMVIIIPFMMAAAILLLLRQGRFYWLKRILYVAGLLVMVRYFFTSEIITRSYHYYDSVFEAAQMFLIAGLIILVIGVTPFLNGQGSERALCLASILIVLITPLGSNNYTYPVINNLFIVAPIILWMFRRIRQAAGNNEMHFTWKAMFITLLTVVFIQGIFFHMFYSFVDGTDGSRRNVLVGSNEIPRAVGMHTTAMNAESLTEVYEFLSTQELENKKLLQFGKAPGLSYLFSMRPAIFSTWPDLDSNTIEKFSAALADLSDYGDEDLPVVIVNPDFEGEVNAKDKYDLLLDFMDKRKYNKVFENGRFEVYAVNLE